MTGQLWCLLIPQVGSKVLGPTVLVLQGPSLQPHSTQVPFTWATHSHDQAWIWAQVRLARSHGKA